MSFFVPPHIYLVTMNVEEIHAVCTDKKEKKIFLIYKEIQNGAVAKSYMTNGLLIYGGILGNPHI